MTETATESETTTWILTGFEKMTDFVSTSFWIDFASPEHLNYAGRC